MEKMTNDDCLTMFNGLQAVKQPKFADIKDFEDKDKYVFHSRFAQAVSLNKKKLKPLIESFQEAEKLSDEYREYLKERDEILAEYAKKDKDGNPEERITEFGGMMRRSYNVPSLHDKNSEVSKKIKRLENKNKDLIDARKKQEEEMKELMNKEAEFIPVTVPWSMIPFGLDSEAMDGVVFMIEGEDSEESSKKSKK